MLNHETKEDFSSATGGIGELANFLPIDQVIAMFGEILPFIRTKFDVCLYNALPGNIFKGTLISVMAMLIYKPLSPILHENIGPAPQSARSREAA